MENLKLIVCISIVGVAWYARNTFLGFATSDKSDHEIQEIFRRIAKEQGMTAVHERICGKHKESNEETDGLKKTTFIEDLAEGLCYEVLDSLVNNAHFKDFVHREIVLIPEDGHVDEDLFEMNSGFAPGPTVMSSVVYNPDILTTKYFKTDKWRLCTTQFSHRTYEFLMLENLFFLRPLFRHENEECEILHLGVQGVQSHQFINAIYPNIRQTVVESDATLLSLAKKWLKTPDLKKDIIDDKENNFLLTAKDNLYDSVWIHGCSADEQNVYECPSRNFLEPASLEMIRKVLKPDGVALFRHLSVSKMIGSRTLEETTNKLEDIFGSCAVEDRFGEYEVIILCTAEDIPRNREAILERDRPLIAEILSKKLC